MASAVMCVLCLSVCLSIRLGSMQDAPKLSKTLKSLFSQYKLSNKARMSAGTVFSTDLLKETDIEVCVKQVLMASILEVYEKMIGQMLNQSKGETKEGLVFVLGEVRDLLKCKYHDSSLLKKQIADLQTIKTNDTQIQIRALREFPWLYQQAGSQAATIRHSPNQMNRALKNLFSQNKVSNKLYMMSVPVFSTQVLRDSEIEICEKKILLACILKVYEKMIGQMLDQSLGGQDKTRDSPDGSAQEGEAEIRQNLVYVLGGVRDLLKYGYQDYSMLKKDMLNLQNIKTKDTLIQKKALREFPWLYQQATFMVRDVQDRDDCVSSTSPPEEPSISVSSTSPPDEPSIGVSSTSPPDEPSIGVSSTSPPDEPSIGVSSTSPPDEPSISVSSSTSPDQPSIRVCSTSSPDEPSISVCSMSSPDEPSPDEPSPDEPSPDEPSPDEPSSHLDRDDSDSDSLSTSSPDKPSENDCSMSFRILKLN